MRVCGCQSLILECPCQACVFVCMFPACMSACSMGLPGALKSLKRGLDPFEYDHESPCGCWELNPDSLEEWTMFLTPRQSFQTLQIIFRDRNFLCLELSF